MILEHESVHARERHYIDIMAAGLLNILQWFNPFARLHGKAIIDNLEYRADDVVTRNSDPVRYQLTMVSLADRLYGIPVFSGLNSTNLKKRIIMMKSKGNRYAGIARIAVIPVFVIILLILCREETVMVGAGENVPAETVAGRQACDLHDPDLCAGTGTGSIDEGISKGRLADGFCH